MIIFQKFTVLKKFYLAVGYGALLLCLGVKPGSAQVKVLYSVLPKANIKSVDAPPGEKAELSMNILDIGVSFPLYEIADRETGAFTSVENTLGFRSQSFSIKLPPGDEEYFPKTLSAINYSIVAIKSLKPKWIMVGILSTGIFTDFENVDGDHFLVEGGAIFAKSINENLTLGLGPVFTYAFGNPVFIPAPLVKYTSRNEKVTVDVKVPQHVVLGYAISKGFQTGVAFRSLYNNYSLGDDRAVDQNGKSPAVVFSDLTIALESSVRLFGPIVIDAAFGSTLSRKFTVDDNKGNELFDRGMENTFFLSAGLKTVF